MEEREVRLSKLEQLKQLGIDPFGRRDQRCCAYFQGATGVRW